MEKAVARSSRVGTCLLLFLVISFSVIQCVSAADDDPPQITDEFLFDPTWDLDLSDSFSGNLGALGFGVSFGFSYSFDAGISLPVVLSVEHPQYILPDTEGIVSVSAMGDDSARAWAYASGSFHASLDAGLAGSYSLVDRSINMGDEVTFTTPLGSHETQTIVADVVLGSETVEVLFVSTTVELRLKITTAVTTATSVSTQMEMVGDALAQNIDQHLNWSEEGQQVSFPFSVNDQEGTYVDMSFNDVILYLESLVFTVVGFTIYLVINGNTVTSISIPMPGLDFVIAEEGIDIENNDGSYKMLADASGTTRDLGSRELSIYVGIPLIWPAFLSPGFLLMIVPAAVGIAYGRKKDNGSKALGSVLLVTVMFGAALNLGLPLAGFSEFDVFFSNWMFLTVPIFSFTGDFIVFFLTYLPWMLGGLAVGGATKRPKAGAALGFTIPLMMYLLAYLLLFGFAGGLSMMGSVALQSILVTSAVTAILGATGGAICRTENNYSIP